MSRSTALGFKSILVLYLTFWHPHAVLAGAVLEQILARQVLVSATDPSWPPYSWLNESGEYEGFDIDVANEIARRMGVKIEFVTPTWDEQTSGNWGRKWDISVGSMTPTADRAMHLVFPAVYAYSLASLVVNKDNDSIKHASDVSQMRIGVIRSSVYEKYLRREDFGIVDMPPPNYVIDHPQIVEYDTADETYTALSKGDGVELDAILDEFVVVMKLINTGKPLKVIGTPIFATSSAVAIEPGDEEFAHEIHRIILDMRADGTLKDISMKWFDFDITTWN
jgi:polar amino acid transport system substrate-binding protein